jgi:hypothetical protein
MLILCDHDSYFIRVELMNNRIGSTLGNGTTSGGIGGDGTVPVSPGWQL